MASKSAATPLARFSRLPLLTSATTTQQVPRLTARCCTTATTAQPSRTAAASQSRVSAPIRHSALPNIIGRDYSTSPISRKEAPPPSSSQPPPQPTELKPPTLYTYPEIASLSSSPDPSRILIDVREPSELLATGTIPSAKNIPIKSSADSFFLSPEEFEEKYGWERPGEDTEVVFFCKAGVRSKAAAGLAQQAGFGGRVGEYGGSWVDWEANNGKIEKI
ncbi:putative thiosulfate sulfurtransferase, mitochondrial [Cyphellophora attinorum]|uniref:Putative thiosulfate sulfurtransferase, mitochondrial n=1 Tax=Cyphellophora attinorum TaxID=1664694 RepID=A0A0N0NQL8_9EURO|nr:putative thiosulfate sulfurtransferase, mitochondrial [Phialophora attinorum]KPI44058.1 putative thiosulfate sulfurtransferase, mitochondrial [Phialophora attinorum]